MKTVFPNDMVAHVWAQQTQSEGRNYGSFYFRDTTIYSYGSHFPIARFVKNAKGKQAVLFTTRRYGQATSQHISLTRQALKPDTLILYVVNPNEEPNKDRTKKIYEERLEDAVASACRARSSAEWKMRECYVLVNEANAIAEFYGWRWRLKHPEFTPEFIAGSKERSRAAAAKVAEKTKRENAEKEKKLRERLAEWLGIEKPTPAQLKALDIQHTNLRIKGDNVETTRGAVVPVEHAKKLWPIIEQVRARGEPFVPNGHAIRVGHFSLDRIEVTGDLKIGCHTLIYPQVQKIARELQLTN